MEKSPSEDIAHLLPPHDILRRTARALEPFLELDKPDGVLDLEPLVVLEVAADGNGKPGTTTL